MLAIDVKELRKEFKVQKNRAGLSGAFKDLLRREYTQVTAVNDITFQIPQGEICGYIGENGAGKSTTIKMLTGILVPTSGELKVNGYVPYKEREKFVKEIGVVFGQRSQLWWDIGVIESFHLLRKVYNVPLNDFNQRLNNLVERLQLGELLNRPVRKLSLGQRMRCELVASLLHNPSIVFLDEPTIGLDIVVKTEIRDFLLQMNRQEGTTILLTTHDLQDIEALCSRVIMLDDGAVIYDGGLEELKTTWSKGREIQFQFSEVMQQPKLEQLTASLNVSWTRENEYSAKLFVPHEVSFSEAMGAVVGGANISDIKIFETNTDEIVRGIYQTGSAEVAESNDVGDQTQVRLKSQPAAKEQDRSKDEQTQTETKEQKQGAAKEQTQGAAEEQTQGAAKEQTQGAVKEQTQGAAKEQAQAQGEKESVLS